MLESAPEKCVFTNHVPRLRLKVNSITRTEFCVWKERTSLYIVTVIKIWTLPIDRFLILWSLHGWPHRRKTDCTACLSFDTQYFERGQLRCTRNALCSLAALICSHDGVWNLISTSDRNYMNTPILTRGYSASVLGFKSVQCDSQWQAPLQLFLDSDHNAKVMKPA